MELVLAAGQGAVGGLAALWRVAYIMIPAFIVLQLFKEYGWLDPLARVLAPLLRPLRLPPAAGPGLATFLLFGMMVGAGVLIEEADRSALDRRQLTVLLSFASVCHAIVDETVVFIPVGANVWVGVLVRCLLGLGSGALAARFLPRPRAAA